jgi:hypothetical protein
MPRGFAFTIKKNLSTVSTMHEVHIQSFLEKISKTHTISLEELKEAWKDHDTTFVPMTSKKARKENNSITTTTRKKMPFIHFCNKHRSIIKEQNPNANFVDISKLLGQEWQKLSPEQKALYNIVESVIPPSEVVGMPSLREETMEDETRLIPTAISFAGEEEEEDNAVDSPSVMTMTTATATAQRPKKRPSMALQPKKKANKTPTTVATPVGPFLSKNLKELRQLCTEQGIPTKGTKPELVERLRAKLALHGVPTPLEDSGDEAEEDDGMNSPTQLDTGFGGDDDNEHLPFLEDDDDEGENEDSED